jgi:hypothetical protein
MRQRGPKTNASEPNATLPRPVPIPPPTLTKAGRLRFLEIVELHPHLKAGDAFLLASFVQASTKFEQFGKGNDVASWERAGRLMLALARALRLVSTTHSRTLARLREDVRPSLAKQYLAEHPDDDDEDSTSYAN